MPARSKAQYRKMLALYKAGHIDKETLEEWTKGVDYDSLPERLREKEKRRKRLREKKRRKRW